MFSDNDAAASQSGQNPQVRRSASSVWALIRMVLVLAVVALAIYGIIFFLKKSFKPVAREDLYLKVLASVPLSTSRAVHVLALGKEAWVIGSGEGGVSLISEIRDQELIDTMWLDDSRRRVAEMKSKKFFDFAKFLGQFTQRSNGEAKDKNLSTGHIHTLNDKLRGL